MSDKDCIAELRDEARAEIATLNERWGETRAQLGRARAYIDTLRADIRNERTAHEMTRTIPLSDQQALGFQNSRADRLEAAHEALKKRVEEGPTRAAWLIERNSMWGVEWFCAGEERWTMDANKAIQFPDKESAEEIQMLYRPDIKILLYPVTELNATEEWEYHLSITEHGFMPLVLLEKEGV